MHGILAALAFTLAALGAPSLTRAATLLVARLEGVPVRIEVDDASMTAVARVGSRRYFVNIDAGRVYRIDAGNRRSLLLSPGTIVDTIDGYRLEEWSAGPRVAGYGSVYNVLYRHRRICAEVLSGRWMKRYAEPLVRSIRLLQQAAQEIRPRARGACGRTGFEVYARNGWPLMVGYRRKAIFITERLHFGAPGAHHGQPSASCRGRRCRALPPDHR